MNATNSFQELVKANFRKQGYRDNEALFEKFTNYELEGFDRGRWICLLAKYFSNRDIKGEDILDIGCGTGGLAAYCASCGANAMAIDLDPDNVYLAKFLARERQLNLQAYTADGAKLPFKDGSFDIVFLIDVLEHASQEAREIVRESLRACKPEGIVFIKIGNGLFPFDPHTQLFWVNMLPVPLADLYIKMRRREFFVTKNSFRDVRLPTYRKVRDLLRDYPGKACIYAGFSAYVPFVSEFDPSYGPFRVRMPRVVKKILASRLVVRLLSKRPFIWWAKDWFILLSANS